MMRNQTGFLVRAATLVALLLAGSAARPADLWYEDNNLGRAGGMPADFAEKFNRPETFAQASRMIRVYMVRVNVLASLDDQFLVAAFLPYLRKNGIKLAIDAGGATWMQAQGRERTVDREIDLLQRLRRLGLQADYISLQSVLSKPLKGEGARMDYPMARRVDDVVAYSKAVRAIFPRVSIGIIDALPSHGKDYRQPYRLLRDAMVRAGMELAYIHLDIPFDIPKNRRNGVTWTTLREVERYVEDDLGLRFGFFATSRTGGNISSSAFHQRVMASLECYAGSTGTPGDFIIASWFPHPQSTIPETAVGDDYPAMRTVLEFGRRLEWLGGAGPAWPAQRAREQSWRAMCGVG